MKSASLAKTVRFSEIVQRCGAPEPHLVLVDPPKDKALQSAIKAERVMTLFQATTGTKVDYGQVGFEKGSSRQYLIFPKSLRAFTGRKVIGIKYDLLSSEEIPKSRQAAAPKAPKPLKPRKQTAKKPAAPKPAKKDPTKVKPKSETAKIIPFRPEDDDEEGAHPQALKQVRKLARQAMDALEAGKQVAAFNLLKRILTL